MLQDHKLRLFSRDSNPAVVVAVREALEEWVHRRFGGAVRAATPRKPLPAPADDVGRKRPRPAYARSLFGVQPLASQNGLLPGTQPSQQADSTNSCQLRF